MLKYILFLLALVFILSTATNAQVQMAANAAQTRDPRAFLVNPAVMTFRPAPMVFAGYHILHSGIGSNIFGKGYIGAIYPLSKIGALGVSGQYFSADLYRQNVLDLNYAYKFWNGKIATGINFGLLSIAYDRKGFEIEDVLDPLLNNSTSKMKMNIGAGVFANPLSTLFVGLSFNHLNQPDISLSGNDWKLPFYTNFSLLFNTSLINPFLSIEQEEKETYVNVGVERYLFSEQALFRFHYSPEWLSFATGYSFKNFQLDYTFRYPLTEISAISGGCHEFMVSYALPAPAPDFEILVNSVPPADLTKIAIQTGDSAHFEISIVPRHNFQELTTLSLVHPFPEMQYRFSPQFVKPLSNSKLSIMIPADCDSGTYKFEVQGKAGQLSHNVPVTLQVKRPYELLAKVQSSIDGLIVESQDIQEESPLLNSVFFFENDDRLSETYYNLKVATESESSAENMRDVAEQYRNILNLVGQRLKAYSETKVTLIGFNSDWGIEKGSLELSRRRARTVRDYFVKEWGIATDRLEIQAKNRPEIASVNTEDGREECQRVDILPQKGSEKILEPILLNYTETKLSDSLCIFSTQSCIVAAGLRHWKLEITDHQNRSVRNFSGENNLPPTISWNWMNENQQLIPIGSWFQYQLTLTDQAGQTDQSNWQKVGTNFQTVQKFKRVQKYRLILFEFARDQVNISSPYLQRKIRDIVEQAKKSPEAHMVLKGYTDVIGTPEYNRELSLKRARTIFDQLVQQEISPSRISYFGLGEDSPIMSNDLPAGRMLNRRVEVFIEYPEK